MDLECGWGSNSMVLSTLCWQFLILLPFPFPLNHCRLITYKNSKCEEREPCVHIPDVTDSGTSVISERKQYISIKIAVLFLLTLTKALKRIVVVWADLDPGWGREGLYTLTLNHITSVLKAYNFYGFYVQVFSNTIFVFLLAPVSVTLRVPPHQTAILPLGSVPARLMSRGQSATSAWPDSST